MATAATRPFAWALAFACGSDNQLSTRRFETTREGYLFRRARLSRGLGLGLCLRNCGRTFPRLFFRLLPRFLFFGLSLLGGSAFFRGRLGVRLRQRLGLIS